MLGKIQEVLSIVYRALGSVLVTVEVTVDPYYTS